MKGQLRHQSWYRTLPVYCDYGYGKSKGYSDNYHDGYYIHDGSRSSAAYVVPYLLAISTSSNTLVVNSKKDAVLAQHTVSSLTHTLRHIKARMNTNHNR